ncbi:MULTISPECIES: hypothetical protein [unclassified Sinorhizobium]|uniref:hypothetical protein n=1 Tax=unclassified Sinorhizobium TaxID=2613772 RepID=UPI0024C40448|nr:MULTISPECIES: hypothetical protein [unclassified Sinorhizobium]MDK1373045.1 hypothetical protein [Sinorhizobium sp. 6-70]MDK1481537.1 hypothetical protein [Sinorhizobium sp. 6-117]
MPSFSSARLTALACAAASFTLVAGCQSNRPATPAASSAALPTMERVALGANGCWFKSGDPAFKAYRLAPELNSFSGRPRILIVPRKSPEARPLAVIQAEGHPARLQAFGPLLSESVGTRITTDVRRWAAGDEGCS